MQTNLITIINIIQKYDLLFYMIVLEYAFSFLIKYFLFKLVALFKLFLKLIIYLLISNLMIKLSFLYFKIP